MSNRSRTLRLLLALALVAGAVPAGRASFTDVTAGSGINHVHAIEAQVPRNSANPEGRPTRTIISNYAAAAAVDVDGDGWTDLLAARYNLAPLLYINQRDGTFRDEAASRGLADAVNAGTFGAGDLDNDGDQDLFVALHSGPRFFLFINDGTGHFTEQAESRGAAVPVAIHDHEAYSVGLVDTDRDGFLDITVSEWGIASSAEDGLHSVLLHNRGAAAPGSFENVTAASGLLQPPAGASHHYGFSSAWADFDGDGWPDLALAGDFGASQMFWNNGNNTFTESERASGVGLDEFGMGVAVADYDGDGRLDFYVTSIFDQFFFERTGTNTGSKLYRNLGDRRFAEMSKPAGVDRPGWGWGAAFFEFDNDGDPDLVVTNGMDAAELGPSGPYYPALNDATVLYQNQGASGFVDIASIAGVRDTGLGKAVVVWDYDNDGDEDLLITQTFARPILYRSDASGNGRGWLRLKLRGTESNRDGIGAVVRVTDAGKTQLLQHNPTNTYLGQRAMGLHVGLGAGDGVVDSVEITWPGGVLQVLSAVAANRVIDVVEPQAVYVAPAITAQPFLAGTIEKDRSLVLRVAATGNPAPVFIWEKDGVAIPGANQAEFSIARIHPYDAGRYRVRVINTEGTVVSDEVQVTVTIDVAAHSVARWWDEFLLDGVRKDTPNPPVHARNLYHLSAAMWDAYWAFEAEGWSQAQPVFHAEAVGAASLVGGRESAQREAISHAACRVLVERFKNSPGAARTLFGFRWLMEQLGFDPDFTGTVENSPAAIGNRIGQAVLDATVNDGANEAGGYADVTGYVAANDPLIVQLPGATMKDPSRWQPLALQYATTQNGQPVPRGVQKFVGVNARNTRPFALLKPTPTTIALDPGAPPQFGTATHAAFVQEAIDCIRMSAMLDPTDGAVIDISPGAYLNNPLGTNDGAGRALNPFTAQPYAPNPVLRGDYARVLAEFWADGPNSETPPGHWNVLLNEVTDDARFERRYGGAGPVLAPLAWDVRAYLALNGAVHDAACAAWGLKRQYDSARPISMIRHLASLGQSSDPAGPTYDALGLPLMPGLIEVVTAESSAAGQRHAHLVGRVGTIAIRTWRGNPADPRTQTGGVGWIPAAEWVPFQLKTFVSPAFPGYVSGHSTFSRAAAEVLTLLTGSPYFPGGLGEYHFSAGEYLLFEHGPSADLTLQWATYYDAADQAGLSRLFGGIHPSVDDVTGRRLGSRIGLEAFLKAQAMRSGVAPSRGLVNLSSRGRSGTGDEVMIAGFVIDGLAAQPVLIRAVGPELERFGIPHDRCEADPNLRLHRSSDQVVLLTNDDWGLSPRVDSIAAHAAVVGAFALAPGGADAAELPTLAPGGYTVVTQSASPAARGIALAEIYGEQLVNLSTRGSAGVGENALVAGFVISGEDPTSLLVRASGPALADFGVTGWLTDPVLRIYRHEGGNPAVLVATNDNWSASDTASLSASAAAHAGAFPFLPGSRDAALFVPLPAGVYSAVVESADGVEGVALAEIYLVR